MRLARAVVALLVAAIAAGPVPARADHFDGDPGSGPFAPVLTAGPDALVTDTIVGPTVAIAQADHEALARTYRVTIPAGWRFAAATVDPAAIAACNAAVSKAQLAQNAEHVAFARVVLETNPTRDDTPQVNTATGFESRSPGPAEYLGDLWFLGWDAATRTSTLCGLVTTANTRIPQNRRTVVFQAGLTLEPDGSWTLAWDFAAVPGAAAGARSITDNTAFRAEEVSVTNVRFQIDAVTPGNHHTDAAGRKTKVAFSRTPLEPGPYDFGARVIPCGADDPPCASAAAPAVRTVTVTAYLPQARAAHEPARIVGPTARGLPSGFGLVRGTDVLTVEWEQPFDLLANPVDRIKAYVVVVAEPNVADSQHFEYVVTDPDAGGFDAREPCGADGDLPVCSVALRFPLGTPSPRTPSGDGVYHVALVTVYGDGHRTDGRCDDGTGPGAPCHPDRAGFPVAGQGVSTWLVLVRPDVWPNAFIAQRGTLLNVLLVDFATHRGEFHSIDRNSGRASAYAATSSTVTGSDDSGIVVFGDAPTVGGRRFVFAGAITAAAGAGALLVVDEGWIGRPTGVPATIEPFNGRRI